jgi:hypothetical protein
MMKIFLEQALLLINIPDHNVIFFKPIDMRLCVLRIRGEFQITALSVPTYRGRKRLYETKEGVTKEGVHAVPLI